MYSLYFNYPIIGYQKSSAHIMLNRYLFLINANESITSSIVYINYPFNDEGYAYTVDLFLIAWEFGRGLRWFSLLEKSGKGTEVDC